MAFTREDIELSRRHFEDKLKTTLGPVEMQEMMEDPAEKDSFVLIDVRNREGYNKEHIPGAVNIPRDELMSRLGEIPKDKEVIVYCWTLVCHLAARAGLTLAENGFFTRELEGGIEQWKAYNMPVESGAMAGAQAM
jgi:rhodanese-related sulfurtransferase